MKIAESMLELVGNTPMVKLNRYAKDAGVEGTNLIGKLEYFNPMGSVKDRPALRMIEDAEASGELRHNSTIIEATSGNMGIGIAFVGIAKGYKVVIVMPDSMSIERRNLMIALGVELILTPGSEGMKGAIIEAERLREETPHSVILGQFTNPSNPAVHKDTTAEEIWRDTDGQVDVFVAGVGTGGTVTGVAEGLKKKTKYVKIAAVEPFDSPVLSGGEAGAHKLQGIGAGFVPAVLKVDLIDEIIKVKAEDAFATVKKVARAEGLLLGISSGAALFAATRIAGRPESKGKNIVVMLPDSGERYLSSELFE